MTMSDPVNTPAQPDEMQQLPTGPDLGRATWPGPVAFEQAKRDRDPIGFVFAGQYFQTRAKIPSGPLFDLARLADAEGTEAVTAFSTFLLAIIDPEQLELFEQTLRGEELSDVAELAQNLVGKIAARPFTQP